MIIDFPRRSVIVTSQFRSNVQKMPAIPAHSVGAQISVGEGG
jgi:hypothetical protein